MAKITLLMIVRLPPKMLDTKSYWKNPINPQLIAPIIIKIRTKFLKDITPFNYYIAHILENYDFFNKIN